MVLETEVYSNPAPNPLPLPRQCRAVDHLVDPSPGAARRILWQGIEPEELRFGDLDIALERLLRELPQHETGDMIAGPSDHSQYLGESEYTLDLSKTSLIEAIEQYHSSDYS